MPPTLTAAMVERLKADPQKRLEVSDGLLPALRLVIQPNGSKSYAVRYRQDGLPKKYTIGAQQHYSLAEARDAARDALARAAKGENLTATKLQARNARVAAHLRKDDIVEYVVEDYLSKHASNLKSAKELRRLFRLELKPWWGRRIHEITRNDVRNLIEAVHQRGAPTTSRRLLANIKSLFSWLVERDVIQSSPCNLVKPLSQEVERERFLSDEELAIVLLAAERLGHPFGSMVQMLALTCTRRSEVAQMKWSELDLSASSPTWRLPKSRTKNGRAHSVPLSAAAVRLLQNLPRIDGGEGDPLFVFTTTGRTPISGFSKAKVALDLHIKAIRETRPTGANGKADITPMPEWHLHDLRRTFATGCQRLGIGLATIEKCLNHASGSFAGIVGVYQRHDYAKEMRAAFDRWGRHVEGLRVTPRSEDRCNG